MPTRYTIAPYVALEMSARIDELRGNETLFRYLKGLDCSTQGTVILRDFSTSFHGPRCEHGTLALTAGWALFSAGSGTLTLTQEFAVRWSLPGRIPEPPESIRFHVERGGRLVSLVG
ncbi:hypothetical protein THAOC_27507 [Thalassiosira oceanica]|uniref:Uncharacterized protein n=1 Tax=Thalassiosira oceanica TaxID=159749 RepID=K0RWA1_THAOC|nr:hypothetical protein THAOC_27507 [Thalassiosira oceanica]|eukprot:EJK53116.1 hypothetical protein THAOC_27507 [Thalassiosira oceanica]